MSAECHDCGADLPYDLNCIFCERRREIERLRGIIGGLYAKRSLPARELRQAIREAFGESRP